MEDEDLLTSSSSSQELQNSTLERSLEVFHIYTIPNSSSFIISTEDVFNPLIKIHPVEVRVHRLDPASLNSTIDLTDEDEASDHVPVDAVQDNAPLEHVKDFPLYSFDIDGRYEYLVADADGTPHVPAHLIPASFVSRIRYGACGRCSRVKNFGYKDWLEFKYLGDAKDVDSLGDIFCNFCGLDCNTQELFDQHVEAIHVRLGWFPQLEECPACLYTSFFPSLPSD